MANSQIIREERVTSCLFVQTLWKQAIEATTISM